MKLATSFTLNNLAEINILAFESSCDETGVALYNGEKGLLGHKVFSSADLHALYGGVVPELASRDHIKRVEVLTTDLLKQAQLKTSDITLIAYTAGPGLVGALLVGATYARSLAFALNIPVYAINHLEGHLLAPFLENEQPSFPLLAVLVSGGHSQFVYCKDYHSYKVLGQSLDDAVGEAFDKTAKLLGLPYPGGKLLSELAEQGEPDFSFKAPMTDRPGLDLSFSGLKTAALNKINSYKSETKQELTIQEKADVARAFENTVVKTFKIKIRRAVEQIKQEYNIKLSEIVLVGGVSANKRLRIELANEFGSQKINLRYARPEFCVDNGAMIAVAGFFKYLHDMQKYGEVKTNELTTIVKARWSLDSLSL